jgi:hypothetical protein
MSLGEVGKVAIEALRNETHHTDVLQKPEETIAAVVKLPLLSKDTSDLRYTANTKEPDQPTSQKKAWPWPSKTWIPSIAASTTFLGSGAIMHGLGYMGNMPVMYQTLSKFALPCAQWALKNRHMIQAQLTEFKPVFMQAKAFLSPAEKKATIVANSKISHDAKHVEAEIPHRPEPEINLPKPTKSDNTLPARAEASPITINGNPNTVHVVIHHHHYPTGTVPKPTAVPEYPIIDTAAISPREQLTTSRIEKMIEDKPDLNPEIKMPKALPDKPASEISSSH